MVWDETNQLVAQRHLGVNPLDYLERVIDAVTNRVAKLELQTNANWKHHSKKFKALDERLDTNFTNINTALRIFQDRLNEFISAFEGLQSRVHSESERFNLVEQEIRNLKTELVEHDRHEEIAALKDIASKHEQLLNTLAPNSAVAKAILNQPRFNLITFDGGGKQHGKTARLFTDCFLANPDGEFYVRSFQDFTKFVYVGVDKMVANTMGTASKTHWKTNNERKLR